MKRPNRLWHLVVVLFALPCRAQEPVSAPLTGQVATVTRIPLPVIINGKQPDPATAANQPIPDQAAMSPTAPPARPEDLIENVVSFDPDLLELDWAQEGTWQLRAGETVIRDFGRNETAGRQMLLLLRQLRVNQHGTVGQGEPILEYWLSDGQAPQGTTLSLRLSALDQRTLRVEKSYGQWCLRDAYRMLFSFGPGEEDARRALAILHKYQFTQVGMVSSANPPILLFLTRPGDALQAVLPGQGLPMTAENDLIPSSAVLPAPGSFPGQPRLLTGGTLQPTMSPSLLTPKPDR